MRYSTLPPEDMVFELATAADAEELSGVAVRSKRHWGYSKEAMELWNQNLTITEDFINTHTVIKATLEDDTVGFFALEEIQPVTRITHYWIDTPFMRKGYGTGMYNYMVDFLRQNKVEKATIVLDPNGFSFFEKKGAKVLEQIEHKVKNKFLYIVEIPIPQNP